MPANGRWDLIRRLKVNVSEQIESKIHSCFTGVPERSKSVVTVHNVFRR